MLEKIRYILRGFHYECEPLNGHGLRLRVRAWSASSARLKAYDEFGRENLLDIVVKRV